MAGNLGMLGFFKYFHFFQQSFAAGAASLGWQVDDLTLEIVLPVGISFYTFQTMSYTLDIYFRKMRACPSLVDYLAYVCFFPQLVAGPIERALGLLPQFERKRTFDPAAATDGCRQMLWGFFKKMVIADRLAIVVDRVYGDGGASGFDVASGPTITFATAVFCFQIYCDFSAYSDIAIGCGRLFGFQLSRNFAYPFFSQSMGELWRRWHITLLTWFRDYVFTPLGGVRGSRGVVVRNVMVTFLLSGLWHGAAWTYVIWGAIMGLASLPEPLSVARRRGRAVRTRLDEPGGPDNVPSLPVLLRMLRTFALFALGLVFFRSPSLAAALQVIERILVDSINPHAWQALSDDIAQGDGRNAILLIVGLLLLEWVQRRHPHPLVLGRLNWCGRWSVYTVVFWSILLFMAGRPHSFIYFHF
jgi:D-alanyl-lipoteichoic acid acyltransferase DltB (MBOAT superfamily)